MKKSKYQEKRERSHQEAKPAPEVNRVVKTITGIRHSDVCHASFKSFKEKKDAFLLAKDVFLKAKDELRAAREVCPNCLSFKATQGFNMGASLGRAG